MMPSNEQHNRSDSWPPDLRLVLRGTALGLAFGVLLGFPCGWESYSYMDPKRYDEMTNGIQWAIHFGSAGAVIGALTVLLNSWRKKRR